jgi:hypothetical protein
MASIRRRALTTHRLPRRIALTVAVSTLDGSNQPDLWYNLNHTGRQRIPSTGVS